MVLQHDQILIDARLNIYDRDLYASKLRAGSSDKAFVNRASIGDTR